MQDLLTDQSGDIRIESADLVIGYSDQQHREHLLTYGKGDLKENPGTGVGLFGFLENDNPADLLREISLQFTGDGMTVNRLGFDGSGALLIEAPYNQ